MNAPFSSSAEQRLITIASGKGGVGKTWFSATLSHALALTGERVLLFDGDLGMANVDIQLGLMPENDIGDVLTGALPLREAVTPYLDGADQGGFDVLAGKSGSGALGTLARERLLSLRRDLIGAAHSYDHVVLDMGAGVDPSVLILSQHRGTVFVVMSPDPTSLTDAYAFIKMLLMRLPEVDVRIIINAATSKREGERIYEAIKRACESFLKISPPLAAIIKYDPKVRDAIRSQSPVLIRHPNADSGRAVMNLARNLTHKAEAATG